jgi:hypothetical protein
MTGSPPNGASGRALAKDSVDGFDLTFAAPKSVSLVRALTNDVGEKIAREAHNTAVHAAMTYLHHHAGYTRVHNPATWFEYVSGHVPGVMSLPIGELVLRGRELPASATVYVKRRRQTATGRRGLTAAGLDAVSVWGGTAARIRAARPVIRGPRADVA